MASHLGRSPGCSAQDATARREANRASCLVGKDGAGVGSDGSGPLPRARGRDLPGNCGELASLGAISARTALLLGQQAS